MLMKRVRPGFACGSVLMVLISLVVTFTGCGGNKTKDPVIPSKATPLKASIGVQVSPAMALVFVAKEQGYFMDEGVDVELKEFTAGKFALAAMLGGSLDFAVSGEVPVCLASLQGNDLRVVTQVVERTTNEVRVVARKQGDETTPEAYFKGKKRKLATSIGGGPEFYTYTFLNKHELSSEIEIISQKPEDMVAALESKSVDAIAIFDPFAFMAESRLGEKAVTFQDAELYSELYVLCGRTKSISENSELVARLLKAMVKSAEFIQKDPAKAKEITLKHTRLAPEVLDGIWANFVFKPALTPRLLEYWKAQAEWAHATKKFDGSVDGFDFKKLIDAEHLKHIQAEAVTLP